MRITADFVGGNIVAAQTDENRFLLSCDLRGGPEWFYWAFCAEGAKAGQTCTFSFDGDRVGNFGPAVSHDLQHWAWAKGEHTPRSFSYTFSEGEDRVYFAHHFLYHPARFDALCRELALPVSRLTASEKGRNVPCLQLGQDGKTVLLTARHHACESTGNYVLEGFLREWAQHPIPGLSLVCVPFVDYDGVVDGDQGKGRPPFDHNRDYDPAAPSRYAAVRAIRQLAKARDVRYAIDFHSPWHCGGENDTVFIPQKHYDILPDLRRFSLLLEQVCGADCFPHLSSDDVPPDTGWNRVGTPCFGTYMHATAGAALAFTLETAYFVSHGVPFSAQNAIATGRAVCRALAAFDKAHTDPTINPL